MLFSVKFICKTILRSKDSQLANTKGFDIFIDLLKCLSDSKTSQNVEFEEFEDILYEKITNLEVKQKILLQIKYTKNFPEEIQRKIDQIEDKWSGSVSSYSVQNFKRNPSLEKWNILSLNLSKNDFNEILEFLREKKNSLSKTIFVQLKLWDELIGFDINFKFESDLQIFIEICKNCQNNPLFPQFLSKIMKEVCKLI